jgi:hypothetical protein
VIVRPGAYVWIVEAALDPTEAGQRMAARLDE